MITNGLQRFSKHWLNEYWLKSFEQSEAAVEDFGCAFDFWKASEASEEETKEAYARALAQLEEAGI